MKKIVICIYLIATYVSGQTFSEDVKKFISVDTNIVAITKVGIIDGTGSPRILTLHPKAAIHLFLVFETNSSRFSSYLLECNEFRSSDFCF